MHNKYAKEGLAAVSVDIDDPKEKEVKDKVLKFLQNQKATFTNLILDEESAVWQEKLDVESVPFVFVFDRDGKVAKKFKGDDVNYAEIEKLAVELLKKK